MNKINELKDETIKTLAQTLKSSGLAASETEAIRMAMNMAQTNNKVNSNFEERKEKNIMGLSYLKKEQTNNSPKQEMKEEEVYAEVEPEHTESDCESCGFCGSNESLNELFEAETKDEFITQDLLKEEQPETTKEIPIEENRPKKDMNSYRESSVNLGDVFKFKE
ncbi:hypothetical protein KO361_04795 [Candidatus Woesearchaeota archaeon]|nr:hypothetical protein [Candidatus Woesearchaeota archaeon]